MKVVLCWYYCERDGLTPPPELTAVYGPFPDDIAAQNWIEGQSKWTGWGRLEFTVAEFVTPDPILTK